MCSAWSTSPRPAWWPRWPGGHYWALQGAETAVYAALALALAVATVAAVRRWQA